MNFWLYSAEGMRKRSFYKKKKKMRKEVAAHGLPLFLCLCVSFWSYLETLHCSGKLLDPQEGMCTLSILKFFLIKIDKLRFY